MTAAPAFDPLGPDVPVIGTAVLLVVVAALIVGHFLRLPRRPAAVPELADFAIATQRLRKVYADGQRVVADLSCRIRPGRIVGLLGPNGAGKTTLLGMVAGLITPTAGEAYVFGHLVQCGAPVLSRVGIALERPALVGHLTGMQMLRTTWAITGRPPHDAHLDSVTSLSGLGDELSRKVSEYSMGMRQRLSLAQAMLGLPDVLLLDEPANGLDPAQVRQLRTSLRDYANSGRTVVLSSHVLPEVEKICDEILVVHRGRITLSSTMADLPRPTTLRLDLGGPAGADAALTALGTHDIASRRTADDWVEVLIDPQCSVTTVLRALVNDGCEVLGMVSTNAFEDAYYQAIADD